MLDFDLGHREVPRIASYNSSSSAQRGRRNQTVGLRQRHALSCELPAPYAGLPALLSPETNNDESFEQPLSALGFMRKKASDNFLDVHGGRVEIVPRLVMRAQMRRHGPITKGVDQHR